MQRDAERLEQRRLEIVDRIRNRQHEAGRPAHERTQPTVVRAVSRKPEIGTKVAIARAAHRTAATRICRVDGDALATARPAVDDADDLVAKDQRPLE